MCVDWIGKQMQVVEYVAVYLNRQIARTVKGECECVARYGRLYAVRERAYPYIIHFFAVGCDFDLYRAVKVKVGH